MSVLGSLIQGLHLYQALELPAMLASVRLVLSCRRMADDSNKHLPMHVKRNEQKRKVIFVMAKAGPTATDRSRAEASCSRQAAMCIAAFAISRALRQACNRISEVDLRLHVLMVSKHMATFRQSCPSSAEETQELDLQRPASGTESYSIGPVSYSSLHACNPTDSAPTCMCHICDTSSSKPVLGKLIVIPI